jgi:hypothetical protein
VPGQLSLGFLPITVEGSQVGIFRFCLPLADIPIFLGNELFHGKFADPPIYRDPGINREFLVVASSACAQNEMNAEGVVTFHTVIFLRYQSFFARLRNQRDELKRTLDAAFGLTGEHKGKCTIQFTGLFAYRSNSFAIKWYEILEKSP